MNNGLWLLASWPRGKVQIGLAILRDSRIPLLVSGTSIEQQQQRRRRQLLLLAAAKAILEQVLVCSTVHHLVRERNSVAI